MEDTFRMNDGRLGTAREKIEELMAERDEARAEVERARREGAEAMREAAAGLVCEHLACEKPTCAGRYIRALPLPGDE